MSCSEKRGGLAKQPLCLNRCLAQLSAGGQLPPGWQVSNKSGSLSAAPGEATKLLRTCARRHAPLALALPKAPLDPQPFQHLFHITFLLFQALWTHSVLSQMFPSSTSPHGMNTPRSAEERAQMVWFWRKLWYGMCAAKCTECVQGLKLGAVSPVPCPALE